MPILRFQRQIGGQEHTCIRLAMDIDLRKDVDCLKLTELGPSQQSQVGTKSDRHRQIKSGLLQFHRSDGREISSSRQVLIRMGPARMNLRPVYITKGKKERKRGTE